MKKIYKYTLHNVMLIGSEKNSVLWRHLVSILKLTILPYLDAEHCAQSHDSESSI